MKDDKTQILQKITPPNALYKGEVLYFEGRVITFSQKGQLMLYIPAE
jgi:hypothetical protein